MNSILPDKVQRQSPKSMILSKFPNTKCSLDIGMRMLRYQITQHPLNDADNSTFEVVIRTTGLNCDDDNEWSRMLWEMNDGEIEWPLLPIVCAFKKLYTTKLMAGG